MHTFRVTNTERFSKNTKIETPTQSVPSTLDPRTAESEVAEEAPVFDPELAKQEILEFLNSEAKQEAAEAPSQGFDVEFANEELLQAFEDHIESVQAGETPKAKPAKKGKNAEAGNAQPRLPRSVELLYLSPLKRQAKYGVPSCDLQLRSYSVPNLEFFCDFALRAAYYLGLPASGPIPLPRITQRWTVPKSNFIHKKSQENFERITLRRLIQIKDGHPETVQIWLAFLQKYAYYGIGMKANVWEFSKLGKSRERSGDVELC